VLLYIHFIAGDMAGHNNLVGHYNSGKFKYIYWDCQCLFEQLFDPKPQCQLVTLADLAHAQLTDGDLKNLCKKNIVNAFDDVPLSNVEHGLMGCAPTEIFHVSGTVLLKYFFVSLCDLIG
jgi:hypothetical protein